MDDGLAAAQHYAFDGRLEQVCQANLSLLRDIVDDSFNPAECNSSWRSDTTLSLARTMYESRDFTAMPILADALQEAGCEDEHILTHCRDADSIHVRGCWLVDLVLGNG